MGGSNNLTLLKDSANKKDIQSLSVSLWNELQDLDENYAKSFLEWCIQKSKLNKFHQKEQEIRRNLRKSGIKPEEEAKLRDELNNVKHRNHPTNIKRGDIVHVKFGVNLGDELSDLDANYASLDGHYGIVINQRGFMFLILPLTSQPQRIDDPELSVCFENLGLPGGYTKSYLAFAKMKYIHFRRISRIHGVKDGKMTLTAPQIQTLDQKLKKLIEI